MRQCRVYVHKVEAGRLVENDDGSYVFTYLPDYDGPAVCIAMPLRLAPYRCDRLFPFFFNMLSEGANRKAQSIIHHIDENDDFGIMLETAQYDTAGAVTVMPV